MKNKPTLYLICGLPGSGKTRLAKKLEKENQAIRFTLDEWVISLYGHGYPVKLYPVYEKRCKELIKSLAMQLLKQRNSVILDFGFFKKFERDKYRQLARRLNAKPVICFVDTDLEVIKKRLKRRNKNNQILSIK